MGGGHCAPRERSLLRGQEEVAGFRGDGSVLGLHQDVGDMGVYFVIIHWIVGFCALLYML